MRAEDDIRKSIISVGPSVSSVALSEGGFTCPKIVPVEAMTIKDFARRYSLCRASVYLEIGEGRLTACKIGGKTVILRQDAENWVANLPRIKPKKPARAVAAGQV